MIAASVEERSWVYVYRDKEQLGQRLPLGCEQMELPDDTTQEEIAAFVLIRWPGTTLVTDQRSCKKLADWGEVIYRA